MSEQQPPQAPEPPPVTAQSQVVTPTTSPLAVVGLIAGIVSWFFVPILVGIVGIILSLVARKSIDSSNGALSGRGMATAGLILSIISTIVWLAFLVYYIYLMSTWR